MLNAGFKAHATTRRRRIAIIGSVGIPNRYGGPEAFAESIAPVLAGDFDVTVTCDRSRYLDDLSPRFKGTHRSFIPVHANGATSPLHDLLALLAVARSDYILVLGVSGGLFFPLFRLICALTGARLLVNIDGVEWRRSKFGMVAKCVLFCSDWLAQRFAHGVIYDNEALEPFVLHKKKSACVEYSGDYAASARGLVEVRQPDVPFALTVCRIEPENNCEILIQGFLKSSLKSYIFVGNWDRSTYGRDLRQRYAGESRLQLLDPIYDPDALFKLRESCFVYLHGHSVGGTNPSLVEILFFNCEVLCFDCLFNRVTAADAARYFSRPEELAALLCADRKLIDREAVRARYTTSTIVRKLVAALELGR